MRQDESLADIVAHPKIAAWRQAFSQFGARPSKYQASVEALVRRARRGDALPPINALVAVYNAVSLRFLLPVGGDDLDLVSGGLHLRLAKGDETFLPLGAEADDPPEAGEIIYADDAKVLCRRWSWRGGEPSKISPATTNAVLNVHGLPPADPGRGHARDGDAGDAGTAGLRRRTRVWYVLDRGAAARPDRGAADDLT